MAGTFLVGSFPGCRGRFDATVAEDDADVTDGLPFNDDSDDDAGE